MSNLMLGRIVSVSVAKALHFKGLARLVEKV